MLKEPESFGSIQEQIARAPIEAGCYFWKRVESDKKNETLLNEEILYIGKAKNIKARLQSYIRGTNENPRLLQMICQATHVEWIITQSAKEALLLEANLIKTKQPKYNVRLKDDKRYPYLCISLSEIFPQIYIVRKIRNDGNLYFGPFSDSKATRSSLNLIHKIFPIRKIRQSLPLKTMRRPCMNFFIKRCLAPCQNNVHVDEYKKVIDEIILFLEGKNEILESQLQERMQAYSQKQEFEKAAMYRDLIRSIRHIHENQVVQGEMGDEDLLGLSRRGDEAHMVLFEIRGGRLLNRKSFPLLASSILDDGEIFSSFLRDYYLNKQHIPPQIYIPLSNENIRILESTLKERLQRKVVFKNILRSKEKNLQSLYKMASRNAEFLLADRLLGEESQKKKIHLMALTKMLKLNSVPKHMECYDISHFQGYETVGSGIVFIDGKADRKNYRHYRIKGPKHNPNEKGLSLINDPAAIAEIIGRRIKRRLAEGAPLPDLFLIDGGLTQVNAAYKIAKELGQGQLLFIGLAKKKEELYFPFNHKPQVHDPQSPGMLLLREMRNEAHRFALRLHRMRRAKKMHKKIVK